MKEASLSIDGAMVILNEDLLVPELASRRAHEQHRDIVCWLHQHRQYPQRHGRPTRCFGSKPAVLRSIRVGDNFAGVSSIGGVVFHDVK